jgi:hypothetical protein
MFQIEKLLHFGFLAAVGASHCRKTGTPWSPLRLRGRKLPLEIYGSEIGA